MVISDEIKQRRKEIREQVNTILIGQVLSHPYFPHDIYKSRTGPLNPSLRNCNPTRYSEALLFLRCKDRNYFDNFQIFSQIFSLFPFLSQTTL